MKIHRFFVKETIEIKKGIIEIAEFEIVHQIRDVLCLQKGEKIILCDGKMNEATGEIVDVDKNALHVLIIQVVKNTNEPEVHGTLYCAVLKKENFELVVQKAVEVGIKEIVPLITSRTVKLSLKEGRLQKIIKEAAEQSGRGVIPKIHEPTRFEDAIKESKKNDLNLFFDPTGNPHKSPLNQHRSAGLWIGPEGGWTDEELQKAKENSFQTVSLGKLTLRAETAAVIGSWIALHI